MANAITLLQVHHADHGIGAETLQSLLAAEPLPEGFFIVVRPLPPGAPDVFSALWGPTAGDVPVGDGEVTYVTRSPDRPPSRTVVRPHRPIRTVVLIGINAPEGVTLFTAYGGPAAAPREVGDPSMEGDAAAQAESAAFWAVHALAR